jgi:redox-sensing transcriptional repressor
MLTLPASEAQKTAEILVKAGVQAILNYAPISLKLPDDIQVQYINPVQNLQHMTYYLK